MPLYIDLQPNPPVRLPFQKEIRKLDPFNGVFYVGFLEGGDKIFVMTQNPGPSNLVP